MTTDVQLSIDLADLSDTVVDQNVTLNSLSGELSTLNRFVSVLNDTVEQMTLSGKKTNLFRKFLKACFVVFFALVKPHPQKLR